MADSTQPMQSPVLQKPPGYRDPSEPMKPMKPPPGTGKATNLPPSFRPKKKRKARCCRVCCCICCILWIVILILTILLGGLFYLWFDPKPLSVHLTSFKISTFNVTSKPEGSYLNARMNSSVQVRNPNSKLAFYYANSNVHISVGKGEDVETEIGSTTVPSFKQGKRNTTSLKVEMVAKDLMVDDGVGAALVSEFKSKSLVVNVEVKTKVGVSFGEIKIGKLGVRVLCRGFALHDGDMPKCTINILKWINIH